MNVVDNMIMTKVRKNLTRRIEHATITDHSLGEFFDGHHIFQNWFTVQPAKP